MFDITIFLDNIDRILNEKNVSKSNFYKSVGISSGNFTNWRQNKSNPSGKALSKIADFLNCSIDYLINQKDIYNEFNSKELKLINIFRTLDDIGKYQIKNTLERELKRINNIIDASNIIKVKTFELPVSVGVNSSIFDDIPYHIKEVDLNLAPHARKSDFALYIRGDGMEDKYFDGDILFIKEQSFIDDGQIGVFIYDNDTFIKKYTKNKDGQIYLISLNPIYKPIKIKKGVSFIICGLVL